MNKRHWSHIMLSGKPFFFVIPFIFVLASCGGGSAGDDADTTAPTITLTGDNPLTVEANSTFIDPGATVTDNVDTGLTVTVTGTVDTTTVGTYTLSFDVSDTAGNAATTETRTVIVVDTTAPTVSSVTPVDGVTDVARDSVITATFGEDLFATTVDGTSFTLSGNSAAAGVVTFDGSTNVASFTPDSELDLLTAYTATLTTDITDLSGNALASNYSWSFTSADGAWGTEAALIEIDNADDASGP
ncbi:MAG: DUF5011 domain-containing protein, partial [Gammaproteobacteria bacterium]|nr:DUF5011 domain-containing protein [Gammaproteobacteria bacterium]